MQNNFNSLSLQENIKVSSKEIAEITGKLHHNIIRDIDSILLDVYEQLNDEATKIKNDFSNFESFKASLLSSYKDSTGRTLRMYVLPKDILMVLLTGYNVKLRTKMIKYIEKLEKELIEQNKPKMPESKLEWIQFALEQEKQIIALQEQVEQDAPKVECYDRVMDTKGLLSIEEFAKIYKELKAGRNNIFKLLRDNKILQSNNIPYQKYAHYFEIKESTYHKNEKEHLYKRVYIKLEYQEKLYKLIKKIS